MISRFLLSPLALCALIPPLQAQSPEDLQQLLNRGVSALQQGQSAEAIRDFRQVTKAAPEQPDGYLGLGMAELRSGDGASAARDLSEAIRLNPQMPSAHLFLGIALYQMSRYEDAAKALDAELKLQPDNVESLTWLGMALLSANHPEEATVPLDRAAHLAPKDTNVLSYRAQAHTKVAKLSYQALYDLDPDSWQLHLALAELDSAGKQNEDAIREYKAALAEQPNNPDVYEALGMAYESLGDHANAATVYEQALKLSPSSPISLFNLGKIRIEMEDLDAGISLMRHADAVHAPAAPTHYYLGYALAQQKQYEEAVKWLEKAQTEQPTATFRQNTWYELARVYQKLGRNEDSQHALTEFRTLKAQNDSKKKAPTAVPATPKP